MIQRISRLESMVTAIIYAVSTIAAMGGLGFFMYGQRITKLWQYSNELAHDMAVHKKEIVDRDAWGRLALLESQQDGHGRTLEKISDNLSSIKLDFTDILPVVRKLSDKDKFITWLFRGMLGVIGVIGLAGVFTVLRAIDSLYGR